MKRIFDYILGFLILLLFYFASVVIIRYTHIKLPANILGLILFSIFITTGLVKEKYVESICNFLLNNMALFFVPFIVGLVLYKSVLIKNWLIILVTIFLTTSMIIVFTGLFVEYGIKLLRLYKIRRYKND